MLGLCFSFPMEQNALDSGTLVRWSKGFSCPGAVGTDVARALEAACRARGAPVHVSALVNDTVGTLAAARYVDGDDAVAALVLNAGERGRGGRGWAPAMAGRPGRGRAAGSAGTLPTRALLLLPASPGTNACYLELLSHIGKYVCTRRPRTPELARAGWGGRGWEWGVAWARCRPLLF